MGLLQNLGNIIKTVAPYAITGATVNNWINTKYREISNSRSRNGALISLACEVGRMNNDMWQLVSSGLELKALHNSDYEFLKNYCNYVVNVELGQFKSLLQQSSSEASLLLKDTFFRCSVEEQCVYLGLLQARSTDMKASFLLNQLIDASKNISTNNNKQISQGNTVYSEGTINKVWLEFDTYKDNVKGMSIHVDLNVKYANRKNCELIAWFYWEDGNPLPDRNKKYFTEDGQVCAIRKFVPEYENSRFEDIDLYIPYAELHISGTGTHGVKLFIGLFAEHDRIAKSDFVSFNFIIS